MRASKVLEALGGASPSGGVRFEEHRDLDVDFGESRNGLWLLKKIMKTRADIKVIVVSGSPSNKVGDWRSEAERTGAVDAFDKAAYTENQILSVFK